MAGTQALMGKVGLTQRKGRKEAIIPWRCMKGRAYYAGERKHKRGGGNIYINDTDESDTTCA